MTFSIVARCARTGMFGVAVSSSSPAVAARCAHARADTGAVASQNITDPSLGAKTLDLLARGQGAQQAIDTLRDSQPHMAFRQLLAVDSVGRTAIHSGSRVLGCWAEALGENVACAGNLLKSDRVPGMMRAAFLGRPGHLADRLLAAMRAAVEAGGEEGPLHSAGLMLVDRVSWPVADLRIDWTDDCPVTGLHALWTRYAPELDAYVTRALQPDAAPRYGVSGDP